MARTAQARQLTVSQRAAQLALRAQTLRRLLLLWRGVNPESLSDTIEVFTEAAVNLALAGYDESSDLAVDYLAAYRIAEGASGIAPRFRAPRPDRAAVAGDLRGAALRGIIDARRAGASLSIASDRGFVRTAGAMIKQVLAGGRMTIIGNVERDRQALGWQRVTSGDPCAFCRMLAGRGPAYKAQATADFQPHDTCGCIAEPFYRGDAPSEQNLEFEYEFAAARVWARANGTMSRGTSNDALNDYRRWLAAGKPEPGNGTATASPATTPSGGENG